MRLDDLHDRLPEQVIVLLTPERGLELRETERHEVMAVTYSTFADLAASCGAGQPCAQATRSELARAAGQFDITMFALDLTIPEGHRYPEPDSRQQPEMTFAEPDDSDTSVVYIPSRPYRVGQAQAVLELQPHEGKLTMLVYSSQEMLRAGCGPHQDFITIRIEYVNEVAWRAGAEATLLDPVLAEESRHTAPVVDWASRDLFS
ncbi:MAG: SAV_915 family protein [Pseudonocardiaceae bacterium]